MRASGTAALDDTLCVLHTLSIVLLCAISSLAAIVAISLDLYFHDLVVAAFTALLVTIAATGYRWDVIDLR
jgi:predicted permease